MRKSVWFRILALLLAAILAGCSAQNPQETPSSGVEDAQLKELSKEQKNAMAMLNYLALTTEEIHNSKNSRLLLEDIYTSLLNEINPGSIDDITQSHLNNVRDVIKEFLNIDTKREMLKYIHNREKAAAIRSAIPNPMAILSIANAGDFKRMAMSVAYTVVDSYNSYQSANDSADHTYFLSGWELDQEESNVILRNRDYTFNYMTDIVQEYGSESDKALLGKLTLNEKAIENFAQICAIDEVQRKIERLTYEQETYKLFGNYWLELADCYYETEEYQKCLDCVARYIELDISIFRRDFNIVPILPKAIVACQSVYSGREYVEQAKFFADAILANANPDDWSVRYFAAQTYMDLYSKTEDETYLTTAYEVIKHNVSELIEEQIKLNNTYLQELQPITLTEKQKKVLTPEEKDQEQERIDAQNDELEAIRKTELPPAYEPLVLNCELLFGLAEKLEIEDSEKAIISSILQNDSGNIFLSKPVNNKFRFQDVAENYTMEITKDELIIPVNLLAPEAKVTATVTHDGNVTLFDDFILEEVVRNGETVDSFAAYYTSELMDDFTWFAEAEITITIDNGEFGAPLEFRFRVVEYSDNWIFSDSVTFESV